MSFNTYFKLTSYAVVACGALALLASEGISIFVAVVFTVAIVLGWRLEDTRWQISERLSLVLIIASLPLFYFDWQYQSALLQRERAGAATLAHLILGLSAIKLWQRKGDRDWVFLYLISFFEILLAAGLSISPLFFVSLVLYLLFAVSTVIAFEIRKSERNVKIIGESLVNQKRIKQNSVWRVPLAAVSILVLITIFALPLFFVMPRVGGAGMGRGSSGGLSGFVGFSDSVSLGKIGELQQRNEVVMRIRVEEPGARRNQNLRWRGVALDYFDNRGWRKSPQNSNGGRVPVTADANNLFRLGARRGEDLTIQTVFLEPIVDTPTLFAANRVVAIQGNFSLLQKDTEDAVFLYRASPERLTYKVFSDTSQPDAQTLRADKSLYSNESARYLQLPSRMDARIGSLAQDIVKSSGAQNRYDAARAIERYLQTNFGYSLNLRAGGREPLADFLFNIKEGHCEYFSTAMTVMLRTQGVAARVVNGFQTGNYNDAADAYIVTQREAHSWVEVYFPETESWITFDPTPASGRNLSQQFGENYFAAGIGKYLEALQMFWLQYVVAFDNQEQRTLARSLRDTFAQNQEKISDWGTTWKENLFEWWQTIKGEKGFQASLNSILQTLIGLFLLIICAVLAWFTAKRLRRFDFWHIITAWRREPDKSVRIIEFYERMTQALAKQGIKREPQQTPQEFAVALAMPEAVRITEAYNRVRFGEEELSSSETAEIENWLQRLESNYSAS